MHEALKDNQLHIRSLLNLDVLVGCCGATAGGEAACAGFFSITLELITIGGRSGRLGARVAAAGAWLCTAVDGGATFGLGNEGESTIMEKGSGVGALDVPGTGGANDGESTIIDGNGVGRPPVGIFGDEREALLTGVALGDRPGGESVRPAAARDALNLDVTFFVASGGSAFVSVRRADDVAEICAAPARAVEGAVAWTGSPSGPRLYTSPFFRSSRTSWTVLSSASLSLSFSPPTKRPSPSSLPMRMDFWRDLAAAAGTTSSPTGFEGSVEDDGPLSPYADANFLARNCEIAGFALFSKDRPT